MEPVVQPSANEQPCAYERFPGAATTPLAPAYRPRQPRASLLHRVVRENLLTFLEQGIEHSANGEGYPLYVEKELRSYIACGSTALGFARLRCPACGFERLLPFSCKNRGICPSCTSRRMSEEAAYLVDMVLPKSRYRQWTFTFPWPIRRLMARDYTLITAILGIVIRALYAYQRRMARRNGHRDAKCASVTFVQRFGGAVNANLHLHVLLPDAVFMPKETEDDELRLLPLAPPEDNDVLGILDKVVRRVSDLVQKRCGIEDDLELEPEVDVLDGAIEEAMRKVPLLPSSSEDELFDETSDKTLMPCRTAKRSMRMQGFSLHANTAVAADNRLGLEKLCRYGMRPPFAHERLSLTERGLVRLKLRRPWPTPDGASCLTFEPVEFLRRLAAIIPPPFAHLIRYHGLFAPRARDRDLLPAAPVTDIRLEALARAGCIEQPTDRAARSAATGAAGSPASDAAAASRGLAHTPSAQPALQVPGATRTASPLLASRAGSSVASLSTHTAGAATAASPAADIDTPVMPGRKRLPWRELLRRVFSLDALLCPKCHGPMTVIAYITEAVVVTKILTHLGLPSEPPALSPARGPAQLELFDEGWGSAGRARPEARRSRAPPSSTGAEFVVEPDELPEPEDDWGA